MFGGNRNCTRKMNPIRGGTHLRANCDKSGSEFNGGNKEYNNTSDRARMPHNYHTNRCRTNTGQSITINASTGEFNEPPQRIRQHCKLQRHCTSYYSTKIGMDPQINHFGILIYFHQKSVWFTEFHYFF